MSADSWSICPRCLKIAQQAHEGTTAKAEAMYGKVSIEDFEKIRAAAKKNIEPEDYRTFREDYEFYGAEQGEVVADYHGECANCHLELTFRTSKKLEF